MQHRCDDCGHSFYVPGQNQPLVIEGGCPECGGHARPEPDQPSPVRSDGDLRNMIDPWTGDDQGGNPLQEGILGQTDGGWAPQRNRDESFASVHDSGYQDWFKTDLSDTVPGLPSKRNFPTCPRCHSLIPSHESLLGEGCPKCGFVINREWPDGPRPNHEVYPQVHEPPKHPVTGEPVTSIMHVPIAPNQIMKMTPRQGKASSADRSPAQYVTPMHSSARASNQTPQLPWQFDLEEVAEPGLSNEEAEEKMTEKTAGPEVMLAAPLLEGLMGGGVAEGAAAGGAAAGGGALTGLLQRAAPGMMMRAMGGGPNFGEGLTEGPADAARPMEAVSKSDDLPGGSTPNDFPKDTDDPEHVDPKEHNDGATRGTANDISVNDMGGSTSPGLQAMEMMLPLVLHYHDSPDAGSEHPLMVALQQLLSDEGHMNGPDDPHAVAEVIKLVNGDSAADKPENHLPSSDGPKDDSSDDEVNQPSKTADYQVPKPEGFDDMAVCPRCHAQALSDFDGGCGNCGYRIGYDGSEWDDMAGADEVKEPQYDNRETAPGWIPPNQLPAHIRHLGPMRQGANHQGPHSPEQIAAVQQYLKDVGRGDEEPNVPMAPWQYEREMAEVAGQPNQPPQDTSAQPQPAQEEAPPEATMPMPGMTAPPPGQFAPTASHAPGLTPSRTALIHDHAADPLQGLPAADQLQQEDRSQEQDSSGAWHTDDGQPLIVGEQYELHTPGVDIPDIVTIENTKGDSVRVQFTGAYELGFAKDITREEFASRGYSFTHVRGDQPDANSPVEEQQMVEPDDSSFSGHGTGLDDGDRAHQVMTSWQVTATDGLSWDQPELTPRKPGAPLDPMDIAHQESEWAKACPTCDSEDTQRTGPYHRYCMGCGNTFTPYIDPVDEYTINDQMPGHPVMDADGPAGYLRRNIPRRQGTARESFMPGSPGGSMPGGVCAQCGGPLQPDGSCAGCERSAVAPGAPGVPPVPAVPQGPQGGRPAAPMDPGGANPSRPPTSRTPYASAPARDPETGSVLDDEAQRLIARLMHNAALDDGDARTAGAKYTPNEQRELIDETGELRNANKLDLRGTHYPQKTSPSDDYLFGL